MGDETKFNYYVVWYLKDHGLDMFVWEGRKEISTFNDIHTLAEHMQQRMGLPALPLIVNWKRID